ncbi:MAG: TonB-dependent receptor [Paludibacter sp.]|nr:TonB-dependent receptor [Paludibacter sp.]
MKKYLFLLLCIIQNYFAFGQNIKVLDSDNKQPIAFASVYFPDSKTGTITDENGIFSTENMSKTVLTQISSVGYKTLLQYFDFKKDTIIFLSQALDDLQEIIVSAMNSKLRGENVLSVTQLSLSNNFDNQPLNLAEKLTNISGVDNYSTGAGIGKPVIRGLSGNRVAVYSQGIRIENQQWGEEHGLGLDENGYENVEIIKGPASLLYGSDALGGVLYFSNERYAQANNIEVAVNSEFDTNTSGWRNTGSFKISKKQFHINSFGGYTSHRDYSDGNWNIVPNSRFHTTDFKTQLGYTGNKFINTLEYSYLYENYGLTEDAQMPDDYKNSYTPLMPRQGLITHLLSSENTMFFDNASKLTVDLGFINNNRKEFENNNIASLNMNLNSYQYNAKWTSPTWGKWTLLTGSQGMYQTNRNMGTKILIPDNNTFDVGVFAMTDYYYYKKAYWQAGIRFDNRYIQTTDNQLNKIFFAFNFSTGIFQPLTEDISLRANISSGFRSPNVFELLSDGVHEGTNRWEKGNRNLKSENAYQLDVALNYQTQHMELFVNPFFNYINKYIYLQPTADKIDNYPVYDYVQSDAMLFGGEAGFHFHPHPADWLHIEGSYSGVFGQDVDKDFLSLMPSQKLKFTLRSSINFKKVLKIFSIFAQEQYSFAQKRITEYETSTPDYSLINCGMDLGFALGKQKFSITISANNLLNEKYFDALSRYKILGINNIGRNIIVKLSIPLLWKI